MTRNQRYDPHGDHAHSAANKKQERAVRDAHRKERKMASYLADDDNFLSFAIQLKKMGLQIRDIPGDGNCLFRALGDQLEGHCRNHYQHRLDTVEYMLNHRHDFEPFVEDDVPFDEHVNNLRKLATHAGNDAIVAFAKLHNVNVMIHQLNGKPLMIQGPSNGAHVHQLHIAYHNGDHYSSIRRVGDNAETPANIQLQEGGSLSSSSVSNSSFTGHMTGHTGVDHLESEIMIATGCQSIDRVREALDDCDYDKDATIATLMQTMELSDAGYEEEFASYDVDGGLWDVNGTGSRIFGGGMLGHAEDSGASSLSGVNKGGGARPKHSQAAARKARETKKMEKKKRAEERHRQKFLGADPQRQLQREMEEEDTLIITQGVTRI